MENKNGIFIIDDNPEDYRKIKNELLPPNCISLLDSRSDDKYNEDLSDEEKKAIEVFSEKKDGALNHSVKYVSRILQKRQECLRMIICDLQINGKDEGGKDVLREINRLGENNGFAQQIPILILSNMTVTRIAEAVGEIMGRCFYFTKPTAYESVNAIKEIIRFMVKDFDTKYKILKFKKRYKVAFSFTGTTLNENNEEVSLREFIEELARELYGEYGKDNVFYDNDKIHETVSLTPENFAKNYDKSEYIIVFLSKKYVEKASKWAKEEWDVIRNLVSENRVFFVKLDNWVKNDDFKNKLDIEERIYFDFTTYSSKYRTIVEGTDDGYKTFVRQELEKDTVIKIGEKISKKVIDDYKAFLRRDIKTLSDKIIQTIHSFDMKRN